MPADLKSTVYAKCATSVAGGSLNGSVDIAQDPHRPSSFRADLTFTPVFMEDNRAVRFDVYTTGDIKEENGVLDCDITSYSETELAALGDVFHPLKEERNGVTNPYADPTRGVIGDIAVNEGGTGVDITEVQTSLLMDLGGKDSLIGRALYIAEVGISSAPGPRGENLLVLADDGDAEILGCCVIARVGGPAATLPPPTEVW